MINKELKLKYIKSLKSGGRVPKYQTAWGKLDKQDELDDWSKYWRFRATDPSARSKIAGGWKPGSRNGYVESDEEYTTRRKEEEEKSAKRRTKHIKKAADTARMIGTLALPAGIAASAAVSLPATLGGIAGGIVGEKAVDYGLGKLADMTGSKVRSWKDLTDKYLGWSPTLQTLTNPGTLLGGGIGAKGAQLANKAANYVIRMDMPRFGHTPTTQYYFKPGYTGMNNFNITSNVIDELSNTRKLFDLSPREIQAGIEVNDKANSFKTIIPYSELDSKLGIKDSKRLFSTLEGQLGDEAIVLDNGIAFESPNEAKNTLGSLVKYLSQSNKTRTRGETPYTEQEIINMLNPEKTGLKDGQTLESFYPGSHGVENWYDARVKSDPTKEYQRKQENVRKYLRTVFGRIKKEDALDLRYFNPKGRSGVVVPENLDEQLSSDSSIMTIRHLLQELKNGRKYLQFTPTGYKNKLNHLGQKNSFRLKGSGELDQLLQNNPELINQLDIRETRLPGFMAIHDKSNRKLLATLKQLDPEEIAKGLNKELSELNKEFAKYNIKINPFTFDEHNVYLPDNMSGILYGKGGKIERIW